MAGQRGFDPIAIVECSYALQGTESEWIDRLLEAVAPTNRPRASVSMDSPTAGTVAVRSSRRSRAGHPAWEDYPSTNERRSVGGLPCQCD